HNCCCAKGADCCVPSSAGVYRCRGGAYDPNNPTACKADGQGAQVPAECCSKVCAPKSGGGGFVCSGCISNGGACTRDADCCGFSCINGICATAVTPTPDGGMGDGGIEDAGTGPADGGVTPVPECLPLGATCTGGDDR